MAAACLAICLAAGLAGCDAADPGATGAVYGTTRIAGTDSVLAGVRVALAGQETVSGDDGKYRFDEVQVGTWRLEASAAGLAPFVWELGVGEGRTVFDPRLTDARGSVAGRVVDRQGGPVEGAEVRLATARAVSDADGRFVVDSVAVSLHDFSVSREGFRVFEGTAMARIGGPPIEVVLSRPLCVPIASLEVSRAPERDGPGSFAVVVEWEAISSSALESCPGVRVDVLDEMGSWSQGVAVEAEDSSVEVRITRMGSIQLRVARVNRDGDPGGWRGRSVWVLDYRGVRVQAGTFRMGWNGASPEEWPEHDVTITRPFEIGATEVTRGTWWAVVGRGDPEGLDPELPMSGVSWSEVNQWLALFSQSSGLEGCSRAVTYLQCTGYRLPTEAEWEYAARGGTRGMWYFPGQNEVPDHAWTASNSGTPPVLHPVGRKLPNPWGLFDVYGNAAEWTADTWDRNYYQSSPQVDPANFGHTSRIVVRGGSVTWESAGTRYSSSSRQSARTSKDAGIGFRIARTLPQ